MKATADYINLKAHEAEAIAKVIEVENSLVGKFKVGSEWFLLLSSQK
jgi:hypothetical protein